MKILRSVNRRGFRIGSAGYFSVLQPNTWFAASRLPDTLHRWIGRTRGPSGSPIPDVGPQTDVRQDVQAPQIMRLEPSERNPLRLAWVLLAAMVFTALFLWWSMASPRIW
jgi:hypothetical protein